MGKLQPKPKPDEVGLCMLSLHIYNSFKIYKPESELLTTLKWVWASIAGGTASGLAASILKEIPRCPERMVLFDIKQQLYEPGRDDGKILHVLCSMARSFFLECCIPYRDTPLVVHIRKRFTRICQMQDVRNSPIFFSAQLVAKLILRDSLLYIIVWSIRCYSSTKCLGFCNSLIYFNI